MDHSRNNHHHHHLGVNKLGKNIRKSPLHHPTYDSNPQAPHLQQPPPPQPPQVYNINKNDFRSIVQQLTGTPSRDSSPARQPRQPQPRPPSTRLQRIRPPPLSPIARPPPTPPPLPPPFPYHNPNPNLPPVPIPHPNPNPSYFPRPPPSAAVPPWAESPVSAYMRYLESSLIGSDTSRHPHPQAHPQMMPPLPSPGLLPSPLPLFLPSPSGVANPNSLPPPNLPSASPLPSPSGFWNLLSPRSPYPLLSPGFQYPPPLTPNFAFSPLAQPGILGAGPQPLLSPGLLFPQSPSGFFPILSPRWRDML